MHISLACSFKIAQRGAASSTEISVCLCTEFGIGSLCSFPLHRKQWRRQMLHHESNSKYLHRLNSNDSFQNILFFFHMQAIFRLPIVHYKSKCVAHTYYGAVGFPNLWHKEEWTTRQQKLHSHEKMINMWKQKEQLWKKALNTRDWQSILCPWNEVLV